MSDKRAPRRSLDDWMELVITKKSTVVTGNMDEKRADQLRSAPFY